MTPKYKERSLSPKNFAELDRRKRTMHVARGRLAQVATALADGQVRRIKRTASVLRSRKIEHGLLAVCIDGGREPPSRVSGDAPALSFARMVKVFGNTETASTGKIQAVR